MKNKNLTVLYLARTYYWVIPMPLINLSTYWILWSMFLVIDYTANIQCSIACNPFKKLTCLPLFWNQNFLTCHNRFFTKIFLPHFGRCDANVMTMPNQLAPKQIANLQNTTAWLQNSAKIFTKRYISATSDLGS